MTEQRISSPTSTGGSGTFFEQHVGAYWLAQLLVRGIPPVLIKTTVAEVRFQTELHGWHTDDFLIICERSGGVTQKLAGQVKRSFSVSATNDECKKAVQDFWQDFKNANPFCPENDRLVLVTLRGSNTLLEHFAGLLDCARAAHDGVEFKHRLSKEGFISAKAGHYCTELCKIITDFEGKNIGAVEIWPFLRLLYVLSLDLNTPTRQTEAQIKNLLAHTINEGDAAKVADDSWSALLALASTGMSEAQSLSLSDLPVELRQCHHALGATEQHILRSLQDHTIPVLRRIRSMIGQNFHLQRAALVQKVLGEMETAQVVVLSGPAGSGKSVIGKDSVSLLEQNHFVFGFRVEEFAQAHIDATLHVGQIPTNAKTLGAILAAQGRKILLIESVERLLEKSTRDAFSDLMDMVAADRSMCVILTCRDYSIEQVGASFLMPFGINYSIVHVPPLENTDLAEVEAAFPNLAYPLKNPRLRNILRNPYFLNKALDISWSESRSIPESEREFRALFWRQIVCADQGAPAGMGRRREEVFQKIAVRRARALLPQVLCNDLDPAVLAALRQDSLIVSSDENLSLVATAHDVLEDWAILQWLDEQHLVGEGLFESLSVTIGAHPAIRRSFRKWVAELVDRNPSASDRLFNAAISDSEIEAHFRDDTLVSLLMVPSVPEFLTRHQSQLMVNQKATLKRLIHLLRVACVKTPDWLAGKTGQGSIFNVPDGPAWTPILRIVHNHIESFTPQDRSLLLGFIEDAVRNISWWQPELEGAEFVAGIAHWLLPNFDHYRSNESRKRVLQVLAKIPKADVTRFGNILRGTVKGDERRDRIVDDFRKMIFTGLDGMAAARDLPDLVVSVGGEYLFASEHDLEGDIFSRSSLELETHFGIKERLRSDFFPASALRGPWIHLLRYHPHKALDFYIRVFNHSADWYAHPRVNDALEPAWEIDLVFADGTVRKQWGNSRLWNLYRGASVGPDVLQSLLMALEKWLLELADTNPQRVDAILLSILHRSESAALSAVIASIVTAHPHASCEALLVLLSARDYIRFDRERMVTESQTSALTGILPHLRDENRIYEDERKHANQLSHRNKDLEAAILNLQLGQHASRAHTIFDRHRAAMPPVSEQNDEDRSWRLALHRMDMRKYRVSEVPAEDGNPYADQPGTESPKSLLRLDPTKPEDDVKEMMDNAASRYDSINARLGLLIWAYKTFKREHSSPDDEAMWQQRLQEAMAASFDDENDSITPNIGGGGPGIVAAVCIRDHWKEMSTAQLDWCLDRIHSEVTQNANEWNHFQRVQRYDMAADRSCAYILPAILSESITESQRSIAVETIVVALTHPIDEVRWYFAQGISEYLWPVDRTLGIRCVNAVSMEATLVETAKQEQSNKPFDQRLEINEISEEAAAKVREAFIRPEGIPQNAYEALDRTTWVGANANGRVLTILLNAANDTFAIAAFVRAGQTLVDWWDERDTARGRGERNYESEAALSDRLQRFVMSTSAESAKLILEPILDAIDRHPSEIHRIVQGLTGIEDRKPNTSHYWYLWGLFADGIKRTNWITRLDDEYPRGRELLSAIFLTSWWKDEIRHWKSLENYAHRVHELFEALPPSAIVLDDYMHFLYHIGEQSLPEAFVRVANSLERGDAKAMLTKTNTVFLLEVLLQRHVYGRPLELKKERSLRQSILLLLDVLVENGSSSAFRMRDDFVTPVSS